MEFLGEVIGDALAAFSEFGPELIEVIALTLAVSGISTVLGVIIGIPLGTILALERFPGSGLLRTVVNVGMGIPPVLVGLFVLLLFWNAGPFGSLGLVFTPAAMVLAQVALAVPVAAGVTKGAVGGLPAEVIDEIETLGLPATMRYRLAIGEARSGIAAAVVAAFGRVISEVGAVLIVGGNILGETRVLTTLIVQESRQARFGIAIAAGIVLLAISLAVNLSLGRLHRPLGVGL
jgi:tungstate transport system permease protein